MEYIIYQVGVVVLLMRLGVDLLEQVVWVGVGGGGGGAGGDERGVKVDACGGVVG